jgi:hypothetical protein
MLILDMSNPKILWLEDQRIFCETCNEELDYK